MHHPDTSRTISAVDPGSVVDPGDSRTRNQPRSPDQPQSWLARTPL